MTHPPAAVAPRLHFRAGPQARKVVALTLFAAACALGAAWWGLDLGRTYGLAEADGGVLRPLWQRAALGGCLALLGLAFLAGMLVYWRFYVVRLDVEDGGRLLRIGRLPPFPTLLVPCDQVKVGDAVHGRGGGLSLLYSRLSSVNAPWRTIRLPGWRWPLILDLHGRLDDGSDAASGPGTAARGKR
jgi:hypothetical protein